MMPSLCISFPLSLLFLFIISSSAHSFHDDGQTLSDFKSLITSDPHQSMADWSSAVSFCNWTGVTCRHRHLSDRVVALNLTAMDLQGTISPSLGNLSFLHSLDLSSNAPSIGRLFRLRTLTLSYNRLDGNIPMELGSLTHLQFLNLAANNLTDFGIAKLIDATSSYSLASTLALKRSMGYIAPEYGLGERVSTQGDVYSYGILLLEMLTRKKPTSDMFAGDLNLHKWVKLAFPNRLKEGIDSCLLREMDGNEIGEIDAYKNLLSFLHVGLLCSKDSPQERPTMRDVSTVLKSLREDLVENSIGSRSLKRSISAMFANSEYNAIISNAVTSNDQSSTF